MCVYVSSREERDRETVRLRDRGREMNTKCLCIIVYKHEPATLIKTKNYRKYPDWYFWKYLCKNVSAEGIRKCSTH